MAQPKFFGLDIGSSSIKIVEIKDGTTKSPKLLNLGSIETPLGTYGNSDDISKSKLASAIRELYDQLNLDTKNAVSAVSERDVFSARVKFAFQNEKEMEESAYWAISKILPVPIDTVKYGYLPISMMENGDKREMEALVISVEKKISDHYAEIIDMAGLNPLALETEGVALVRSISRILPENLVQGALIMDIGSTSTGVCIVRGQNLVYSTSIQTGSDVISRSLAQAFSLDIIQADEYKKAYGVDERFFDGKIANVIRPILDNLLLDINRALQFYKQEQPEVSINSIKLLGETSAMPGLVGYVTKYLGITAEIVDPFTDIILGKVNVGNKQAFATAIGLAMKSDFGK